jgi:hypothetical protein
MDIFELITWDMSESTKTAIIWDNLLQDYRHLNPLESGTPFGESIIVKCPVNLSNKTIDLYIDTNDSVSVVLDKLHYIYSSEDIKHNMEGNTFTNGLSEANYPYFYLNVSS